MDRLSLTERIRPSGKPAFVVDSVIPDTADPSRRSTCCVYRLPDRPVMAAVREQPVPTPSRPSSLSHPCVGFCSRPRAWASLREITRRPHGPARFPATRRTPSHALGRPPSPRAAWPRPAGSTGLASNPNLGP